MPFAVTENFDSRKVTWTKDRELATLTYTGYGSDDDHQKSRDSGFVAHILKPINLDTLNAAIERARIVAV